jgi:hypothetical protein
MSKKQLSRTKLRQAARLAIAIHGYDLLQGFGPKEAGLTEEEFDVMTEETHKIMEKLAGEHPMNFGSVDAVINYFRQNL